MLRSPHSQRSVQSLGHDPLLTELSIYACLAATSTLPSTVTIHPQHLFHLSNPENSLVKCTLLLQWGESNLELSNTIFKPCISNNF